MVMEIVISAILLLVGIAALIVIHICVVGRAFGGEPTRRDSGSTRAGIIPGLKPHDVKNLPCIDYRAVGENGPGNRSCLDCAVCLESFKEGEKCRVLSICGHFFHAECIDYWLLKTAACPVCRRAAKSVECEVNLSSLSGEEGLEMV